MIRKKIFRHYKRHLQNYIMLSILTSLSLLMISAVSMLYGSEMSGEVHIPNLVHYLGVFISVMMLVMGTFYLRSLSALSIKKKELAE